jgi:oxygen-independent coproporphyrinogen-3 oxidase
VQDFNPEVQHAVNRIQPFDQTQRVVGWLRQQRFGSIAIDLIYGLPHQTLESFARTLDLVLLLDPDRLAVFSYAHVPWIKPSQKILERASLPDAATKLAILKLTVEKLTNSGYVYIGMDHFAKASDDLVHAQRVGGLQRNFQGYSTGAGADIYGFGVSAISQTEDMYWQNEKNLAAYYTALDEGQLPLAAGYRLTEDDRIRRRVIMRLMCDFRLDFDALSAELGIDFRTYFRHEIASLAEFEAEGLVFSTHRGVTITDPGRLLIRNVAMRFDAYLRQTAAPVYSRTI